VSHRISDTASGIASKLTEKKDPTPDIKVRSPPNDKEKEKSGLITPSEEILNAPRKK